MKPSPVRNLLWVVNLGILAGGSYLAYDFYQDQTQIRDQNFAQLQKKVKNDKYVEKPEEWTELRGNISMKGFLGISLQTGRPHVFKLPIDPNPEPGTEPVVELPDLGKIRANLQKDLERKITVEKVWAASAEMATESFVTVQLLQLRGISLRLELGHHIPSRIYRDDPQYSAFIKATLDAILIDMNRDYITFAIASSELDKALKEYTEADLDKLLEKDRPIDGRFHLSLSVPYEDPIEDLISQSSDARTPRTGSEPSVADTHLSNAVEGIPPAEDVNESPWELSEENRYTKVQGDDILLGWEDMNNDAFSSLTKYASVQIDPRTGTAAGIRVADNLPNDGNLAFKAGARGGDVIKSINGQPVTNLQEVKNTVIRERDQGVTKFDVVFERNGAERTKVFHLPKKKE